MGNYDVFTQYVRDFGSRRRGGTRPRQQLSGPEIAPKFLCPRCGDRFIHEGACPRCEVMSYDVTQMVAIASDSSQARALTRGWVALSVLTPIAGGVGGFVYFVATAGGGLPSVMLGLIGLGLSGPVASFAVKMYRKWKQGRELQDEADARSSAAERVEVRPINELKQGDSVRFRGKVNLDPDGKPQIRVQDKTGQIRVRIDETLNAYDNDGEAVAFLRAGDEVEVIGELVPGEGPYRGEKELGREGVTVFVKTSA